MKKCIKLYRGENHHSFGKPRSEETKRKISESRKKNKIVYPTGPDHAFFGKHHREESKKKISESIKELGLVGEKSYWYGKHPSEETRKKLSEVRTGENNPFYGKHHSDESMKKNAAAHLGKSPSKQTRQKMSVSHKGKQLGVDNPAYGKPPAYGSGWGWAGWYKGWHFRSLGELRYVIHELEEKGLKWESAEKAEYRIPYQAQDGRNKTYCADFLVEETRLVEVKCKRMQTNQTVLNKQEAAIAFCKKSGWNYEMADSVPLPLSELEELVDSGQVRLLDRWQGRFEKVRKNVWKNVSL